MLVLGSSEHDEETMKMTEIQNTMIQQVTYGTNRLFVRMAVVCEDGLTVNFKMRGKTITVKYNETQDLYEVQNGKNTKYGWVSKDIGTMYGEDLYRYIQTQW
jgi:hypothetical protein